MNQPHIFISHSSKDDLLVKELCGVLESLGLIVWVDSRNLRGGAKLNPEIDEAIEQARQVIVVLSRDTVESPWVRKEVQKAIEVERGRKDEGYRVIPVLIGLGHAALKNWFDEEPLAVPVKVDEAGSLSEALPDLLAALGERLPDDRQHIVEVVPRPFEELILRLNDLKFEIFDGKRRAKGHAQLVYKPADTAVPVVESRRFVFIAPLGVIEAEELRWYLEEYFVWPVGIFKERAERVEAQLPKWGERLYRSAFTPQIAHEAVTTWQQAGDSGERRFSVFVERELPEDASEEEQATAGEAAAELLSLPWELLHDGRGFLFHGKNPVRVRRRLPNRYRQPARPTQLPIRILLVSPRPEDKSTNYIDHRISALPLVDAVESLGELALLSILTPPTFPALEEALSKAEEAGQPYDVVHFDGHGVYDRRVGLGGLCFEDPNDVRKLEGRAMQLIHAVKLAEVIRDHRIPLVFLEACQSAKTEEDPTASVAAKLLEEGVTSIVAMSHSVLIETARRFVRAFYRKLAEGKRVGAAMIAGQRELHGDANRGKMLGAGELHLQDWFVPVLYQEEQDPQLVTKLPPEDLQQLEVKKRRLSLGKLPAPPPHEFIGRSRELLAMERLLYGEQYAVIRGQGGEGKTTLAVELARWLVRVGRFRRVAFVSLEQYTDARGVLDGLGRQLLPEGEGWSVAQYSDLKQALQPVERALRDGSTIILLDNLESVLPDSTGQAPPGAASVEKLFELCQHFLEADAATRIVFTTREPLPAPFDHRRRELVLGALNRDDAVELVSEVMKQAGISPKSDDPGSDPQEVTELVEAVSHHARALVLLAREVARRGVRATTENLRRLMEELHSKYPDDRENSLYASVELSLRRLPQGVREQVKMLGMFHGGVNLAVLGQMVGAETEAVNSLAMQLVEVGLAEDVGYLHLRLDPALPPYLLRAMSAEEQEDARERWAEAMEGLTYFLYEQHYTAAELSSRLTLLELPNLLAMLKWVEQRNAPERVVELANKVIFLLSLLGLPQALAEARRVLERITERLGEWGRARFMTESARIDQLFEREEVQEAHNVAQKLLERSLAAGEEAYPDAAYDIAMTYVRLGRVLQRGGAVEAALAALEEGSRRFKALEDTDRTIVTHGVSVALTDIGNCLKDLGRLDEAAASHEEAVKHAEEIGDKRQVAVSKNQLGIVRLLQARYEDARENFDEARRIFERLGEPRSVAALWHQIGLMHRRAGELEQAERALRQSLSMSVQQKILAGEAASLYELGHLYDDMGQLEEAVKCFRQSADVYVRLKDQRSEGTARTYIAETLIKLREYNEARRALLRAIKCKEPYGHAAESWKTWSILYDLEHVNGNPEAAVEARLKAVASYLAYRRAGGQSMTVGAKLCALAAEAIKQGKVSKLARQLAEFSEADVPQLSRALLSKVEAILSGDRNAALVDDSKLNYHDAAELRLLLEELGIQ
jgi:tetratricopeptide (TPR) repeat protein